MPDLKPPPSYHVTAPDRIGLAMLAGSVLIGTTAVPLAIAGGTRGIAAVILAATLGIVGAMALIVVLAGPVWLISHRYGARGPVAAATAGGLIALGVALGVQLLGTDGGGYRWASALATAVPVTLVGAAVALVMHGVAYRRLL